MALVTNGSPVTGGAAPALAREPHRIVKREVDRSDHARREYLAAGEEGRRCRRCDRPITRSEIDIGEERLPVPVALENVSVGGAANHDRWRRSYMTRRVVEPNQHKTRTSDRTAGYRYVNQAGIHYQCITREASWH